VKDLLLAVPSRGRPRNIARLWEAMQATCQGDTTLAVGLDADDPARWDYPYGPAYEIRDGLRQVVAWINELAVPHAGEYRYIGHIGDDNVPSTPGWDVAIMEALEAAPFAFGNDLYPLRAPGSLCTHVFTRSEVVAALGYLGPPVLRHMYVDDVWMAWGQACGITFLPGIHLEHLHFTTGKAALDSTYVESQRSFAADAAAFTAYCATGLDADIARIRETL
jgi:hypothetical protein